MSLDLDPKTSSLKSYGYFLALWNGGTGTYSRIFVGSPFLRIRFVRG